MPRVLLEHVTLIKNVIIQQSHLEIRHTLLMLNMLARILLGGCYES